MQKYTESFKEHDRVMSGLRTELQGRLDTIIVQVKNRVSVKDMKLNFKALNDLLLVKFG